MSVEGVVEHSKKYGVGLVYKDYFISKPVYLTDKEPEPNRFTLCKMGKDNTFHYVVADFYWNYDEPQWEFKSCGTRFLETYTPGLCNWLCKCMAILEPQVTGETLPDVEDEWRPD